MNHLEKIINHKRQEVITQKQQEPLEVLKTKECYRRETSFFASADFYLIAEFKRCSPSKGIINGNVPLTDVVKGYQEAGVSACSVLCDTEFFGGSLKDLEEARSLGSIPLLRKDFIIDKYQVHQAKAYGADIILLIAAVLSKDEFCALATLAKDLGLKCLAEIHSLEELEKLDIGLVDILGVNNRDLTNFNTSIEHSLKIIDSLPESVIKISESGINSPEDAKKLLEAGFNGFLIGEQFMKSENPGLACKEFIERLCQ